MPNMEINRAGGDERFAFGMKLIDGGDLGEIGYAITQVNTQVCKVSFVLHI